MHIYMILYAICFVITIALIMMAVNVGDRTERDEEGYTKITKKQWGGYIMKAILWSAIISVACPITLALYAILLIAAGLALLDGEQL